jgi:predicted nucleic acid-binding protein
VKARYLADTSAIGRIQTRKAGRRWSRAIARGMVAICTPVELEVLAWVTGGAEHRAMIDSLERSYSWYPVPDDAWQRARRLQDLLADHGQHNGASPTDLVVAVTAERHGLTVLHDDNDYETISRVTGLPVQRVTD